MINKSLIKSIFHEDEKEFMNKDISFIGSHGYRDPSSDKIPEKSDIPVQGLDNPYSKSGVDINSTYHPEDASDVQEFVIKIENDTGIKLSDKIVLGQDGLKDLLDVVDSYIGQYKHLMSPEQFDIDQYKFRYQNYNKQTDAKRAELDSKIAKDTIDTLKNSSDKFVGSEIINKLTKYRDAIKSKIGIKKHGTSHGTKISAASAENTFNNIYTKFVDSLSELSSQKFAKSSDGKFSLTEIDNILESVKSNLINLRIFKKKLTITSDDSFRGTKDQAKYALEALQSDYYSKAELFEDEDRPTLSLNPKLLKKAQSYLNKLDRERQEKELEQKKDEERRLLIKDLIQKLKGYIEGDIVLDSELNLVIEYYATKYILKQLSISDNKAEEFLSKLKGFDKKSDIDQAKVMNEIKDYIDDILVQVNNDINVSESFINSANFAMNSWGWVK